MSDTEEQVPTPEPTPVDMDNGMAAGGMAGEVLEQVEEPQPPPPEPEPEPEPENDRPVVELFVKAAVDKMKNGPCPTCHRYFLIFYILRERGLIDLVVTTFLPENPPKEVLEFSSGMRYPLVKVHKGVDASGQDMTGMEADTVDEIEAIISRFACADMASSMESRKEATAEKVFENLYMKFNQFLKVQNSSPEGFTRILEHMDEYLQEKGHRYLLGERLTRADCYFLPTLQHIRVAGKAFRDYEIPTEYSCLWKYLADAYETDAMKESCPADREIITHYQHRLKYPPKQLARKRPQLMQEDRTFSVPTSVLNGNNGEAD